MFKKVTLITVVALATLVGILGMEAWADIVVNEVMARTTTSANEFIELYNTGSVAVNVSNWTFSDGDASDIIVTWASRNPYIPIAGCDTNTISIPSDSYAVILDPDYAGRTYNFPPGTIILTIKDNNVLGGGALEQYDTITLFSNTGVIVSTYGVYAGGPIWPTITNHSVERIDPDWLDIACNWAENTTSDSTPGAINSVDADYTGSDPTAEFTIDSTSDSECHTFNFNGTSSTTDGCQSIDTYTWNFGDGTVTTTTSPTITHQYSSDTTCTVTLTVEDSGGDTHDTQVVIITTPANPTADAGPDTTSNVFTVTFNGSGITDGCQSIDTWSWGFGDGDTGTGQSTTHTYSNAGTYTVTLTVTDSGGDTDSDTLMVVILPLGQQTGASLHGPGSMIVWEDYRNGNWEIYLYGLGPDGRHGTGDDDGEFQITNNPSAQQEPDVWVSPSDTAIITWTDFRNSGPANAYGDIYYTTFDTITGVAAPTRLTTDPWHQAEPAIYGDTIIYTTTQNGANNRDLYYYNRATGASGPLVTTAGNQSNADIFGDTVVYQDDEGVAGNEDIWVIKACGTKERITGGAVRSTNPSIDSADGRYVAYQSYNGTNWDIYVYDLNTGITKAVATSSANEENPSVNNGKVAYQKKGSSNIFVYYINGGTTYQVTNYTGAKEAAKPTIYIPTVAWQERDNQNDDWKIAFYTLADPNGDTPPGNPASVTEAYTCTGSDLDYICTGSYYVHWTAPVDTSPSGISHYVIEECINGDSWAELGTTTDTCYQITGRQHPCTYQYRARAVSNAGAASDPDTSDGIMVDATCATTPARPIEGDSACVMIDSSWDGDGSYQVFWTAASDPESGIDYYYLEEMIDTGDWNLCDTTPGNITCYTVFGRLHGHTYYYRTRAVNRAGCACGDWSETGDGITIDTAPVSPVSQVVEGDNACQREDEDFDADGNYWVSWDPVLSLSGITAYELAQCTDTLVWTTLSDTITDTCYQVTGNSYDDTYYYRVRARNGANTWGSWQDTSDGITVDSTGPACPPNITLEGGARFTYTSTQLSATWDTPTDPQGTPITGYQYAIGTSPGDNSVLDWSDTTDTGATVTGLFLTNGQTYYFSVKAKNYLDLWGDNCSDSITVYLNEWAIVFPATGSATSHCTAGVNPAATADFDPGLDLPVPPIPVGGGGEYVVVYLDHPEYPNMATRQLSTDIRKRTEPLEDFKDTWPICILQSINTQGHEIKLTKPNFVNVPTSLDVLLKDETTGEVKYLQFNGVNLNTYDTLFSFDSNSGPQRCYTLMASGSDSTPDEPGWIKEDRDTFPTVAMPDDDYDTDGIFYVAWAEVAGAVGYELQQYRVGVDRWTTVQENAYSTYTNPGGVLGTTYEHRVRAIDGDGFYSYWTTGATITVDSTLPTVPSKPWTTPSGYSNTENFAVCWNAGTDSESGVCTYTLRESSDGGATWTEYSTTDTCYNITGKAEGNYIYQVRAINCAGLVGDYSDTSDTLFVDTTAPDSVANVWEGDYACEGDDSDGDEDGNYWVAWTASTDSNPIVAYKLWEGKAGQPGWTIVADTITDTCYQVTNRDSGTYYYRVEAQDAAGNRRDTSKISDGIDVAGRPTDYCHQFVAGWSLISIPIDPTYIDPKEGFPCINYGTCWLIGYQTNTGYFYDDSLSLGEGYWLGLNSSDTFCFPGTPLLASSSDSYPIPINAGWNLIGCPYPLNRTSLMIRNSATGQEKAIADALAAGWIPLDKFYEFDPLASSYVATTTLRPYYGYWFGSLIDGELLVMDITEPSPPSQSPPSLIKEDELLVKITASSGRVAVQGGIGLSSLAEDGLDLKDSLLPPDPKGDYISLYTNHPENRLFKRFSTDVRGAISHRQMEEFEFIVETNLTNKEITLSWNPSEISKGYRLILVDETKRIDMKMASSYSYNSGQGSSKTFRIEATRKAPTPSSMGLFQNYPNPFNPETWIPFKLDDDAKVEFRIYTITGQLIRTINCGYREAGEHVTNDHGTDKNNLDGWGACYWDGRNNQGDEVASGVYFYQLVANGKVLTKKMVVLK